MTTDEKGPRRRSSHWAVLNEEGGKLDSLLIFLALLFAVVGSAIVAQRRGFSPELLAMLAIIGLLLARQAIARQHRVARELEERYLTERAFSSTLEHRVTERTAELAEAQRVLQRMWTLGHHITLELNPSRVLERFMEAVVDVAQADGAVLGQLLEDGRIKVIAAQGITSSFRDEILPADSAMGVVARSGRAVAARELAEHPATQVLASMLASREISASGLAVVPLHRSGDKIGSLSLITRGRRDWSADELARIESFADMLSVALANAELVEGLRQAEWRFRTLFRAAPDAVFTVLQSGRLREANDFVRELVGLDPVQVLGRKFSELVVEEDREAVMTAFEGAFAGKPARLEARLRWHGVGEQSDRFVEIAASKVPEAEPASVLVIARDMTDEREMRARLMETERLAAVGELVAGVAHEVNNPLSSISAYSQLLLRDTSLSPSVRESVEIIRAETSRATQVVKDLLAFARKSTPERQPVEMLQVIEQSLRLRAYQLSTSNIAVDRDFPAELPPVVGDARQLQQVVLNLITNAIQAMAAEHSGGSLRISTRAEGKSVVLEVADSGPGVPADARAHIFEPFFTTKREGEGTGLGLSVSYGIVTALGGRIELVRNDSSGACFRVTLPAADPDAATGVKRNLDSVVAVSEPVAPRSALSGLRLLVVDDEAALRRGIEAFGRLRGFTVVTADEGRSALELVRATSFDAVVCDLRMPGMGGVEFHEALRNERPGLAARTVFMTGDMLTPLARSAPASRQPLLPKPFTFERLEEALVSIVRR
jgi:two-component system, NtrC family, sensor kinase